MGRIRPVDGEWVINESDIRNRTSRNDRKAHLLKKLEKFGYAPSIRTDGGGHRLDVTYRGQRIRFQGSTIEDLTAVMTSWLSERRADDVTLDGILNDPIEPHKEPERRKPLYELGSYNFA